METVISSTQEDKVAITVDMELADIFVNVTVSFKRRLTGNKGTETETIFADDYVTEQHQVQFNASTLQDLLSTDLEGIANMAIEKLKEKYK